MLPAVTWVRAGIRGQEHNGDTRRRWMRRAAARRSICSSSTMWA